MSSRLGRILCQPGVEVIGGWRPLLVVQRSVSPLRAVAFHLVCRECRQLVALVPRLHCGKLFEQLFHKVPIVP